MTFAVASLERDAKTNRVNGRPGCVSLKKNNRLGLARCGPNVFVNHFLLASASKLAKQNITIVFMEPSIFMQSRTRTRFEISKRK